MDETVFRNFGTMSERTALLRERRAELRLPTLMSTTLNPLRNAFDGWADVYVEAKLLRYYVLLRTFRRWQQACDQKQERRAERLAKKKLARRFNRMRLRRRAFEALARFAYERQWARDADSLWLDHGYKLMERGDLGHARGCGKAWAMFAASKSEVQKAVAYCDSYASAKSVRTVLAQGPHQRNLHSLPPGFIVVTMKSELMASTLAAAFESYFRGSKDHRVHKWWGDYSTMAARVQRFLKRESASPLSAISLLVVDANDPESIKFARAFQLISDDCVAGHVRLPPTIACFRPSASLEPTIFLPLLQNAGVVSVVNAADLSNIPAMVEDSVRRCCAAWERNKEGPGSDSNGERIAICSNDTLTARIVSFSPAATIALSYVKHCH